MSAPRQRRNGSRGSLVPNVVATTDERDVMRLLIYHCIADVGGRQPSDVKLYASLLARALYHGHPALFDQALREELESDLVDLDR